MTTAMSSPCCSREVGGEQFRVAEGDGDRGAQLVRRVLQELPLVGEQADIVLADHPDRVLGRQLALAVPHRGDEDGRHERNLGQLLPGLAAPPDVKADAGSRW